MPAYQNTPFKEPVKVLTAGLPEYLWGSFDDRSSATFGYIISDSAVTTTATVTFLVTSGPVPVVGDSIAVRGAARSANLNVVGTVLTVSAEADAAGIQNGVVTVTYAISSTTLGTASDAGQVQCARAEVGEALVDGASRPVALAANSGQTDQARGLTVVVSYPSVPTASVITLQQAVNDRDSEYANVAVVATVAGSSITVGPQVTVDPTLGRFFRTINSGTSGGTNPSVVVKILG